MKLENQILQFLWGLLMKTIELNLGDKLEIEIYSSNGERTSLILASQYERLLPDGSMDILAPIKGGRFFPVNRGVEMGIIYEKSGELYKFKAEVIERWMSGNIHFLRIIPKSGPERLQRRFFFRFECILDLKYRLFEKKDTKDADKGSFKKAITKDISGGGLCILTEEEPKCGWYLEGIFDVGSVVRFIGKVLRVTHIRDRGRFHYEAGIEFIDISELEREKVISFIFDSQRKMLKKGWSTK